VTFEKERKREREREKNLLLRCFISRSDAPSISMGKNKSNEMYSREQDLDGRVPSLIWPLMKGSKCRVASITFAW